MPKRGGAQTRKSVTTGLGYGFQVLSDISLNVDQAGDDRGTVGPPLQSRPEGAKDRNYVTV